MLSSGLCLLQAEDHCLQVLLLPSLDAAFQNSAFLCFGQVTNIDSRTLHVNGSPATCVNLAVYSLVPDVDFVITGPNVGHNVGRSDCHVCTIHHHCLA